MGDARETVRKVGRGRERPGCPVSRGPDGSWQIHGYAATREVLRSTRTVQAGLGIETVETPTCSPRGAPTRRSSASA
ncbi:hypothetical protein ACIBBD_13115 [Streptomyces sp. NPDC051315]|uniref:hypothetical protein n=1 Tax=Streptomyces sp. NPDC051315 TaxID=3365650 RepID=UPI00378F38AE